MVYARTRGLLINFAYRRSPAFFVNSYFGDPLYSYSIRVSAIRRKVRTLPLLAIPAQNRDQ